MIMTQLQYDLALCSLLVPLVTVGG